MTNIGSQACSIGRNYWHRPCISVEQDTGLLVGQIRYQNRVVSLDQLKELPAVRNRIKHRQLHHPQFFRCPDARISPFADANDVDFGVDFAPIEQPKRSD